MINIQVPDNFYKICNTLGDYVYHTLWKSEVAKALLTNVEFDYLGRIQLCFFSIDEPDEIYCESIIELGNTIFLTQKEAEDQLRKDG